MDRRLGVVLIFLALMSFCLLLASATEIIKRTGRRVNIPLLGIGRRCTGCPPHFCDDDPGIIHGYCCGCARFYDVLPITCPPYLNCPLNGYGLCEDYEYMMHCCCS